MKFLFYIKILIFWINVILIEKVDSECIEEENYYQCEGGQKCIPIEWLCDRAHDCPKGDDEYHIKCGNKEERGNCEAFHFECIDPHSKRKKCVRFEWKCDGNIDCENGIDEEDCETPSPPFQSNFGQSLPSLVHTTKNNNLKIEECNADEFKCFQSNECIERDKVCDDKKDCKDGSDESIQKCSMPPIKPLIQPILKQNQSTENVPMNKLIVEENYSKENILEIKTTIIISTTTIPIKQFSTSSSEFNYQNIKSENLEYSKTHSSTTSTFFPQLSILSTQQQQQQQPLMPIKNHKISNAMINPISQIKPMTTTSPSLSLILTKSVYSNLPSVFATTAIPKIATTPISNKIDSEKQTLTTSNSKSSSALYSFFPTQNIPDKKQLLQIPPIVAEIVSSKNNKTSENPRFLKTYKMSAKAIKEKPERFSVTSQSNTVFVSSSNEKNLEPIHPKIVSPIIPLNKFQILIPISVIRKENQTSSEESKTKTKEKFENGTSEKTTTVP